MACDKCKREGNVNTSYLVLAEETSNTDVTYNGTTTKTKTYRKLEHVIVHYCGLCLFKHFLKYATLGLFAGCIALGLIVLCNLNGKYNIDIPLLLRVVFILMAIYIGTISLGLLLSSVSSVDCCEKILKSKGKLESIHNYKVCVFKTEDWDKMQKKLTL